MGIFQLTTGGAIGMLGAGLAVCLAGAGSARGTGGMRAKLEAAESVMAAGIPMVIVNGADPEILYDITAGEFTGTYFGKTE